MFDQQKAAMTEKGKFMNYELLTQIIKMHSAKMISRLTTFLVLLTGSFVAFGSSVDVTERVSHDIDLINAFKVRTEFLSSANNGDFVTIGAGTACDFDSAVVSIQTVIDSGAAEIRVASNGVYQNNLTIDNQSIVIRGGFADCIAAGANQQVFSDLAVIDGSSMPQPVIFIIGSEQRYQVRLENLVLLGGTSQFPILGGGLSVNLATVDLQLLRMQIRNNSGESGAGMNVDDGFGLGEYATTVTGRDVIIQNNNSTGDGGGLSCFGEFDIVFTGVSLINNNTAKRGGGVHLRNGCKLSMYSEVFDDSLIFLPGLYNNESQSNGGGAYLSNEAELYLFGQQMCGELSCLGSNQIPIYILDNEAGFDLSEAGNGGGFYMGPGTQSHLYANGLILAENTAREDGGGGYVGENGGVIIERQIGGCWNHDRCNLIIDNQSGTSVGLGGAFNVTDGGELKISQTYLEENRADFGTAISASGENTSVTLEGVVLDDNGNDGSDGFSDFSVIRTDLGAAVSIKHSTVVDNNVQNSVFEVGVALDSSMSLINSIVHDPGSGNLFGPVSGPLTISCLLAHEGSSFSGSQVVIDQPEFIDRLGGDYHLSSVSPAIDMCQQTPLTRPLDMDAEPRGWDDPNNNNGSGDFDAGADESYVNDVIFKNQFEAI